MMNSEPPKRPVAVDEFVVMSRRIGNAMLITNERRFFTRTTKSARSKEVSTSCRGGLALRAGVLVTDFAPGQADEDVLERDLSVGHRPHPRVVLVFFDQVQWPLGR